MSDDDPYRCPGCDYTGTWPQVQGHLSSKQDIDHEGVDAGDIMENTGASIPSEEPSDEGGSDPVKGGGRDSEPPSEGVESPEGDGSNGGVESPSEDPRDDPAEPPSEEDGESEGGSEPPANPPDEGVGEGDSSDESAGEAGETTDSGADEGEMSAEDDLEHQRDLARGESKDGDDSEGSDEGSSEGSSKGLDGGLFDLMPALDKQTIYVGLGLLAAIVVLYLLLNQNADSNGSTADGSTEGGRPSMPMDDIDFDEDDEESRSPEDMTGGLVGR